MNPTLFEEALCSFAAFCLWRAHCDNSIANEPENKNLIIGRIRVESKRETVYQAAQEYILVKSSTEYPAKVAEEVARHVLDASRSTLEQILLSLVFARDGWIAASSEIVKRLVIHSQIDPHQTVILISQLLYCLPTLSIDPHGRVSDSCFMNELAFQRQCASLLRTAYKHKESQIETDDLIASFDQLIESAKPITRFWRCLDNVLIKIKISRVDKMVYTPTLKRMRVVFDFCLPGTHQIKSYLSLCPHIELLNNMNPLCRVRGRSQPLRPFSQTTQRSDFKTWHDAKSEFIWQIEQAQQQCLAKDKDLIYYHSSYNDLVTNSGFASEVQLIHDFILPHYDLLSVAVVQHPGAICQSLYASNSHSAGIGYSLRDYISRYLECLAPINMDSIIHAEEFVSSRDTFLEDLGRVLELGTMLSVSELSSIVPEGSRISISEISSCDTADISKQPNDCSYDTESNLEAWRELTRILSYR